MDFCESDPALQAAFTSLSEQLLDAHTHESINNEHLHHFLSHQVPSVSSVITAHTRSPQRIRSMLRRHSHSPEQGLLNEQQRHWRQQQQQHQQPQQLEQQRYVHNTSRLRAAVDDEDVSPRIVYQGGSGTPGSTDQKSIIRRAGRLLDRLEAEQLNEQRLAEWRKVSIIFDRFFFLIIFLATGGVTLTLLMLAPRFSHRSVIAELAEETAASLDS